MLRLHQLLSITDTNSAGNTEQSVFICDSLLKTMSVIMVITENPVISPIVKHNQTKAHSNYLQVFETTEALLIKQLSERNIPIAARKPLCWPKRGNPLY